MASTPNSRPFLQKPLPLLIAALLGTAAPGLALANASQWACELDPNGQWTCKSEPKKAGPYPPPPLPVKRQSGTEYQPQLSKKEQKKLRKQEEAAAAAASWAALDWFPRDALNEQQQAETPRHCDGAFIEPENDNPEAGWEMEAAPMRIGADQTAMRGQKEAVFVGGVEITKGDMLLRADEAVYNPADQTLTLVGNVEVRQGGALLKGDDALIDGNDGTGKLSNARVVIHEPHVLGKADQIARESEHVMRLTEGSYTRCSPKSNAWALSATDIKIDNEKGKGTAKHAKLRVKDVPIFYWPYMSFPTSNQRKSGVLWPTIGTAKGNGGLDLTVPIYWNIAPNWDATIAPRYISERGLSTETEVRHLNRYSEWQVSGAFIDDKVYDDQRWVYAIEEEGTLPGNWYHEVDYTRVSDNDYLNDLNVASLDVKRQTHLNQRANMRYAGSMVSFSFEASQYQTINDTVTQPYKRLPQLHLSLDTGKRNLRPRWLLVAQATQFDVDKFDTTGDGQEDRGRGSRLYLEPGISLPVESSWGFFNTTVKAKGVAYALDDNHFLPEENLGNPECTSTTRENCNSKPSTVVPMASIDTGLIFDRLTNKGNTQTFEPRLYYLYTKYEDQEDQPLFDTGFYTFDYNQLFRESRYTGYDRINDANQLSLGLTTRLFEDSSGTEKFWASVGQIFYFDDRRVNLTPQQQQVVDIDDDILVIKPIEDPTAAAAADALRGRSEVAAELGYQWTRGLRSYATALYDPSTKLLNQAGFQFRYITRDSWIFNLAHSYRRLADLEVVSRNGIPIPPAQREVLDQTINQSDLSGVVPMSRHWSLLARWNYDHTNSRSLEQVAGIEYNSCCWQARLLYQTGLDSNLDREYGLFFQIVLKGLGGTGNKVRGILEDAIVGFEEREKRVEY